MPNPLSKVLPSADYTLAAVGSYPLRQNEHLARLAMEGISSWADVDLNMLRLYMVLAGGPKADAAAVFFAIESDGARKAAISALAKARLNEEQQTLFAAILKVIGRKYKERNKLAHWVWGFSPQLPDALLLADPKVVASVIETARTEWTPPHARGHIFVYTETDFLKIISDNEAVARYAFLFIRIIQEHPANADGSLWRKISEAPEVAEILSPPEKGRQLRPKESGNLLG